MLRYLAAGRLAVVAVLASTVFAVAQAPATATSVCTGRYVGVSDAAGVEGGPLAGGSLTFTVWSYGCGAATVRFHTMAGPIGTPVATPNVDYVPVFGELHWNLGDPTNRQVTVPFVGETLVEPDEAFSIRLHDPIGAVLGDPISDGAIINDDELIIGIPDGKPHEDCAEEDGSCGALIVTSAAASFDVTVHFATRNGTAIAGQDYAPVYNRIVTIPAGARQVQTSVVIFDDGVPEPEEHFFVIIKEPSVGTIGDGEAMLTIAAS